MFELDPGRNPAGAPVRDPLRAVVLGVTEQRGELGRPAVTLDQFAVILMRSRHGYIKQQVFRFVNVKRKF